MANKVTVQVLGGSPQILDNVCSIAEVKRKLNLTGHSAAVNGAAANDDTTLADFNYVTLSPAVKGGQ